MSDAFIKCLTPDCGNGSMTRGLCSKCYQKARSMIRGNNDWTWEKFEEKGLAHANMTKFERLCLAEAKPLTPGQLEVLEKLHAESEKSVKPCAENFVENKGPEEWKPVETEELMEECRRIRESEAKIKQEEERIKEGEKHLPTTAADYRICEENENE